MVIAKCKIAEKCYENFINFMSSIFFFLLWLTVSPPFHLPHVIQQSTSYYGLNSTLAPVEAGKPGDKNLPLQEIPIRIEGKSSAESKVYSGFDVYKKSLIKIKSPLLPLKRYSLRRRQNEEEKATGRKAISLYLPERKTRSQRETMLA